VNLRSLGKTKLYSLWFDIWHVLLSFLFERYILPCSWLMLMWFGGHDAQDFKTALREDSMDFAVFIPSVQTRKRPTPRSTTNPTPRSTMRVRRTAAPSVTKARGGARGDDSDDADDDDWTGGPRMLDFSGGGRVTRQRVQV
jgi:hypothetical protein